MSEFSQANRETAITKAHSTITMAHPEVRDWLGLSAVLEKLYDDAAQNTVFEHEMAMFSWDLVQRIEEIGHPIVAERLGITVDELVKRVLNPQDLTMSEVRYLGTATETLIDYKVRPRREPTAEDMGVTDAPGTDA